MSLAPSGEVGTHEPWANFITVVLLRVKLFFGGDGELPKFDFWLPQFGCNVDFNCVVVDMKHGCRHHLRSPSTHLQQMFVYTDPKDPREKANHPSSIVVKRKDFLDLPVCAPYILPARHHLLSYRSLFKWQRAHRSGGKVWLTIAQLCSSRMFNCFFFRGEVPNVCNCVLVSSSLSVYLSGSTQLHVGVKKRGQVHNCTLGNTMGDRQR